MNATITFVSGGPYTLFGQALASGSISVSGTRLLLASLGVGPQADIVDLTELKTLVDRGKVTVELGGTTWTSTTGTTGLDAAAQALDVPKFQFGSVTLATGTATVNSGVTLKSTSEIIPYLTGAITGSTNFGSLRELKSSRVNGPAGTASFVIEAVDATGIKDADAAAAAGIVRYVVVTP